MSVTAEMQDETTTELLNQSVLLDVRSTVLRGRLAADIRWRCSLHPQVRDGASPVVAVRG